MNAKAKFLFFCMIFVGSGILAQRNIEKSPFDAGLLSMQTVSQNAGKFIYKTITVNLVQTTIATKPSVILYPVSYSLISPGYYTQNFGFFCKKELQLEKVIKVPFKFRLGSVQQCDWMEGKANATIR